MPKGEIAGTIGGDDKDHSPTRTQNVEETVVEVPGLELQGCSPPGDRSSIAQSQIPSNPEGGVPLLSGKMCSIYGSGTISSIPSKCW